MDQSTQPPKQIMICGVNSTQFLICFTQTRYLLNSLQNQISNVTVHEFYCRKQCKKSFHAMKKQSPTLLTLLQYVFTVLAWDTVLRSCAKREAFCVSFYIGHIRELDPSHIQQKNDPIIAIHVYINMSLLCCDM